LTKKTKKDLTEIKTGYQKQHYLRLVRFSSKSEPEELPVSRKDGFVKICVLEIYPDKPVLGSNVHHR